MIHGIPIPYTHVLHWHLPKSNPSVSPMLMGLLALVLYFKKIKLPVKNPQSSIQVA